jgi:hypothetical protein
MTSAPVTRRHEHLIVREGRSGAVDFFKETS